MPKIVDYEERKKEIVENALEVFAVRGYFNTSLSDISERCGIGRTTIYQYFKNKDDIFYYVVDKNLEELKAKIEIIAKNETLTFVEKLKKIVFEIINENRHSKTIALLLEFLLIIRKENNESLKAFKQYTKYCKSLIREVISKGIEEKEIKSIDSESMANTIFSFVESFAIQSSSNSNIDIQMHLNSLDILIDGLKA